jgi:hypothetical protein
MRDFKNREPDAVEIQNSLRSFFKDRLGENRGAGREIYNLFHS